MKILLVVKRENEEGPFWVQNAVDEWSIEEAGIPYTVQKDIDTDPADTRTLWVEIPDDSISKLWDVPNVAGQVKP